MSSMQDMLNSLMLNEGTEKTASYEAAPVVSEQDAFILKAASAAANSDELLAELEKSASNYELEKTAEEAEAYGRFMAKGFYAQLQKEAAEDSAGGAFESVSGTVGSSDIAHGGGGKQMSEGNTVDAQAAKDPSMVLQAVKAKLDAVQAPASPNPSEDSYEVVQKIIATAKEMKQHPSEMPNNG